MGRYRSLQSIMLAEALKGITDNQTITAYKKDCKLFAAYCKEQGVKRPDQLQGKEKELLQGYDCVTLGFGTRKGFGCAEICPVITEVIPAQKGE